MNKVMYWMNESFYETTPDGLNGTIFQKCSEKGMDMPCFCYHESLSIAGNCSMCLVEVNNSAKLVVSCAMPMLQNMKMNTSSFRVNKARQAILEWLLVNHPLDCPICDQGGECDSQDMTLVYGSDRGSFYEYSKRAVFDKECGPFMKTIMTSCMHCTSCMSFLDEISEVNDFGMLGRGNASEISTYIVKSLNEELSGNIIDLCPVGALTSKPYAFNASPWELNSLESMDIMDSLASSMSIDYFNDKVYSVLPMYDKLINEDWMTNKARFVYDTQNLQSMKAPMFSMWSNSFMHVSYLSAFAMMFSGLFIFMWRMDSDVLAFSGPYNDMKQSMMAKKFFNSFGCNYMVGEVFDMNNDFSYEFLMNLSFKELACFSAFFFMGLNLSLESPLMNFKMKKMLKSNINLNCFILGFSSFYDQSLNSFIGNSIEDVLNCVQGKNGFFLDFFKNVYVSVVFEKFFKKMVCFFLGISFFGASKMNYMFNNLKNYVNAMFFNSVIGVMLPFLGYISTLEISPVYHIPMSLFYSGFYFLDGCDYQLEVDYHKNFSFFIYFGSHYDDVAMDSRVLFPSKIIYENNGVFMNLHSSMSKSFKAISGSKYNAFKSNDEFYHSLWVFSSLKYLYPFTFLCKLTYMMPYFKFLKLKWYIKFNLYDKGILPMSLSAFSNENDVNMMETNMLLNSFIMNYYSADTWTRNSKTLHLASVDYMSKMNNF